MRNFLAPFPHADSYHHEFLLLRRWKDGSGGLASRRMVVNQKTGLKSSLTKLQQKEKWESETTVILTQTIYTSQSRLSSASPILGR